MFVCTYVYLFSSFCVFLCDCASACVSVCLSICFAVSQSLTHSHPPSTSITLFDNWPIQVNCILDTVISSLFPTLLFYFIILFYDTQTTNTISFLFSLFGTGMVIKKFGLTATLIAFPVLMLVCTALVWVAPNIWVSFFFTFFSYFSLSVSLPFCIIYFSFLTFLFFLLFFLKFHLAI